MNHIQFYEQVITGTEYRNMNLRVLIKYIHELELANAKDVLIELSHFIKLKQDDFNALIKYDSSIQF